MEKGKTMRLIDADALDSVLEEFERRYKKSLFKISAKTIKFVRTIVFALRTADAVSRGVHEQVRWERDIAIEQLESYGVSLGEKAEVAKVVHGHWFSLTDCSNAGVYCSVCNKKVYKEDYAWCNRKNKLRSNYCPNCGADMRERKDNA